jgi:ribonuclease R
MLTNSIQLKKRLTEHLSAEGYRPLKAHELADELGLSARQRTKVRSALKELAAEGLVRKTRGSRWISGRVQTEGLTGVISLSPQGFGMVKLDGQTGPEAELFIPPRDVGQAMHGDKVRVELLRTAASRRSRGGKTDMDASRIRAAGRVLGVVERKKDVIVGLLMRSAAYDYVIPDHPRILQNIRVASHALPRGQKLMPGHKVVVRIQAGPHGGDMLQGEVVEDLGDPDAPGVDVLSILRDHQIATGFSKSTEKEARSCSTDFGVEVLEGRLDLRNETIITIDPADAKDHDDAVSLKKLPGGGWQLGVHIADVSHFVTPGSAIDRDAREHGNSVYMVDRFIPMLPPYLTGEVCSLKAGRDRLAYSVFITYDERAQVKDVAMNSSIIHPCILLDYEKVQGLIVRDEPADIPAVYHETLRAMHELASKLRQRRMRHGAIDLTVPEVYCRLDAEGRPVSITRRMSAEAYHLIEEFMLAANVAVAERIYQANVPAIYRVHEEPGEDQWAQMAGDLQQLGIQEAPSDRHDIQRIGRAYQNEPIGYPVSIAILRNFKRALYHAECSQHFGLAFDRYTHFTSPIRRYADLVVHRILKSLDRHERGLYSAETCEEIAEHCSDREREADEAEEQSLVIKRIQYYQLLLDKGEIGPWPALITGSAARGLLVEMVDTLQRGFIPTHALPDPNLKHERTNGFITGYKGQKLARIGEVIPVELMRVDTSRRSIELRWVSEKKPRRQRRR